MDLEELGKSLTSSNVDILGYIPYLLQDLWALGGRPEIHLRLCREHNISPNRIIDLGCGKACTLLTLLPHFPNAHAVGIDALESFIASGRDKALSLKLAHRCTLRQEDLCLTVGRERNYDLLIYGVDSDILGNLRQTLRNLAQCLTVNGHILIETVYSVDPNSEESRSDTLQLIHSAGFRLLGEIIWPLDELIEINKLNYEHISRRAHELARRYPELRDQLDQYLQSQLEECRELEEDFFCVTLLCQKI